MGKADHGGTDWRACAWAFASSLPPGPRELQAALLRGPPALHTPGGEAADEEFDHLRQPAGQRDLAQKPLPPPEAYQGVLEVRDGAPPTAGRKRRQEMTQEVP